MKSLLKVATCAAVVALFVGCEQKEKVLDIESPAGGIEIQKSNDGVEIDLKSDNEGDKSIEIEVPKN